MLVDFDILTVIIGFFLFLIIAFIFKLKCKKSNLFIFFLFIMFVYILNVLRFTLFPFPMLTDLYPANLYQNINFIPFKYGFGQEPILNIIMTIPLGFGLPFISNIVRGKILIPAILSGLLIESLQFIIALTLSSGFTSRTIDITDVICNFLGTIIGYCFLVLFSKLYLKLLKYNDLGLNNFWHYIFCVASRVSKIII